MVVAAVRLPLVVRVLPLSVLLLLLPLPLAVLLLLPLPLVVLQQLPLPLVVLQQLPLPLVVVVVLLHSLRERLRCVTNLAYIRFTFI